MVNGAERLDVYLNRKWNDYSRSFYKKFIRTAGVKINHTITKKPHFLVGGNDIIEISKNDLNIFLESFLKKDETKIDLESITLYSNKNFVVINKPPFITTEALTKGFFSVHRLDKDTSGVLVVAKDPQTQAALQEQWQRRAVAKSYIALLKGKLTPAAGAVEARISRSQIDRKKMAVSSRSRARSSFTEYKVEKYLNGAGLKDGLTLVSLFPTTGRTHQIRVHCSSIGYPVVGDSLYGDSILNKKIEQLTRLGRQFLHAKSLRIIDPTTKKEVEFSAPLPPDLKTTLDSLQEFY